MPVNPNLDITVTDAQRTAINGAIDTILTTLAAIGVVNLSPQERKETPNVEQSREPYVKDAINNLAVQFPNFAGLDITIARATNLVDSWSDFNDLMSRLAEVNDRIGDLSINAKYLTYKFTLDMYNNAEQYRGRVAGADTIYDALSPMFAGQGNFGNDTPPTP